MKIEKGLKKQLTRWLENVGATYPYPNPNYDAIQYAKDEIRIREVDMPKLESDHAKYHNEDWTPPRGWWEKTGMRR